MSYNIKRNNRNDMRTTKRTTNAYSDLENDLRQDIMANRLAGGETIPTEKELMESYGIGRNTVRRALANLVEEGLLRKVHGCGTFVIPPEERTAKTHTRKQSGRQILFLSLSTAMSESSFRGGNTFEPIYAGLNGVFQKAGCNLLLTQIGMDWTPPPCLASRDVGGVIFHGRTDYSFWQKYIRPLPHVGIQYQAPALESDFVALDNYAYSALSVQHLHRLGHRRIGFLSDEIENQLSDERFRGYLQSMKELGLPVEERYCITWQRPFVDGVLASEPATPDYQPYLEKAFTGGSPPTALVCIDDHRASFAMTALEKMGLAVPRDISLTGSFNTPARRFGKITGVCTMLENICREAARQLLAVMEEPKQTEFKTIMIRPEFVSGDTTRAL